MSQPAERLDKIDAPQFGQTLNRRTIWPSIPPGSLVRKPGPYVSPAQKVTGDWSIYFARQQAVEPNNSVWNDKVLIELSIGTGQSALQYQLLPELPTVGTVIHFSTEVTQAYLSWENPPFFTDLQSTDLIVSWAAPGRPQSVNVKQRFTGVSNLTTLPIPADFVCANAQRIPMFATSVQLRQPIFVPSNPYITTLAIFATTGGTVLDMHVCDPLATGVTTTLTIPTQAGLFMMGTASNNPANFWEADWTVIA